MGAIGQYLPFLIPVIVVEIGLLAAALIHLIRHKRTRTLNVWIWAVIIIVLEIFGPLLYFWLGREEE